MSEGLSGVFTRLPTPAKILLIISLALLPIGLASAWAAARGLQLAHLSIETGAQDQARVAGAAIDNLIRRNRLAVRVAANAALAQGTGDVCLQMQSYLATTPDVGREFAVSDGDGRPLCSVGDVGSPPSQRIAPGDFRNRISPAGDALLVQSGVMGGSATARITTAEMIKTVADKDIDITSISLMVGNEELIVKPPGTRAPAPVIRIALPEVDAIAKIAVNQPRISTLEQIFIFLPLLMWAAAALISWWMVHRLLIRPLRRLQTAVIEYQPGDDGTLEIPPELGPATEIHELGDAFRRAVERIEGAEVEMRAALEGQRRLVREVHHRVKNNLQVVASMLSIHGRSAEGEDAKAAYSSIGRRVDALSVVHRNHYAEMEETRGIALRPLMTELAAGLRAAAPAEARAMPVELDLASPSTTQDVAVAVAFLLTEIIEFAMLRKPKDGVEIALRRNTELTAILSVSASVLVPDTDPKDHSKLQFERILDGLARQLRSPLERKLGRYTVTLPIFPED